MEEKLEEILSSAEYNFSKVEERVNALSYKYKFLEDHGFHIEKKWVENEIEATTTMYRQWKDHIEKTRELLNMWNS